MVPHLAKSCGKRYKESLVSEQSWPSADLKFISTDSINIVIQAKKEKLVLKIPKDLTAEETKVLLMEKKDIKEIIGDNKIKKIIVVPNKILHSNLMRVIFCYFQ